MTRLPLLAALILTAALGNAARAEWRVYTPRNGNYPYIVIESGFDGFERIDVQKGEDGRLYVTNSRTDEVRSFLDGAYTHIEFYGDDDPDMFVMHPGSETSVMCYGGAGDDWLEGGDGNDVLHGEDGRDDIYGHGGNDSIDSGSDFFEGAADGGGGTQNTFTRYVFTAKSMGKKLVFEQQVRGNRASRIDRKVVSYDYDFLLLLELAIDSL